MVIHPGRLMPVLVLVSVALVALVSAAVQSLIPLALLTITPIAIMAFLRLDWLSVLTLLFSAAHVTIPSLSQRLTIDYVIASALMASATLHSLIRGEPQPRNAMRTTAAAFLAVMLLTAAVRGFGLKALGSDLWGGTPYVQLLVSGLMFLQTWRVQLTRRQWVVGTIGLCVLSLLPTIAHILNRLDILSVLNTFVHSEFDDELTALSMSGTDRVSVERLQVANVASTFMFLLAMLLFRKGVLMRAAAACALAAAIFLTGISGHRVSILYGSILIVAFGWLNHRVSVFRRIVNPVSVGILLVLVVLAFAAPHLPLSFQRAISWVPFAEVSQEARADAAGTWSWRLEVWRRALTEARQYLWLGKGFAFSAKDVLSFINWSMQDMDYVMISRNYHNGVLSLLIDLGLAGLITGAAFVAVTMRAQWRRLQQPWNSPVLRHIHQVFLASFIAQVLIYVITAGSTTTFAVLFLWTFVMAGVARTDATLQAHDAAGVAHETKRPAHAGNAP